MHNVLANFISAITHMHAASRRKTVFLQYGKYAVNLCGVTCCCALMQKNFSNQTNANVLFLFYYLQTFYLRQTHASK